MVGPKSEPDDQPGLFRGWKLQGLILAVGLLVVLLLACVLWIPRWLYPDLIKT